MGKALEWLPPRPSCRDASEEKTSFVKDTPDIVRVLILHLARGSWTTLTRLVQLACLSLDFRPLFAHELANAGATGVILDVLCQAPRHHPAWPALSTAATGLLTVLVRCEGSTEAAQPQALRMLLAMLESDLTCGPARQAVATALHCLVAQRTVHRDKLVVAGALPVLLRVLRRLDVLCDLIAVQEILWTLVYLTDEAALGADSAATEFEPEVAERLVPLLFLYGMPWHGQHGHMAALATRALHVQVAGHDVGKDVLRAAGALSVLVDLVRRHAQPYVAAAAQHRGSGRRSGPGSAGTAGVAREGDSAAGDGREGLGGDGAGAGAASHQQAHHHQYPNGQAPGGRTAGQYAMTGMGSRGQAAGQYAVAPARPPAHQACDVHLGPLPNGNSGNSPITLYNCSEADALGPWTPWQRLLAVLLIQGLVPGLGAKGARRARRTVRRHAAEAADLHASDVTAGRSSEGGSDTSSILSSELEVAAEDAAAAAAAGASTSVEGGAQAKEAGAAVGSSGVAPSAGCGSSVAATAPPPGNTSGDTIAAAAAAAAAASPAVMPSVVEGARLACYGLLLPFVGDAGDSGAGGAGAAAAAVGGALLRRRLCPLRESLATLKTLLCDCEANQLLVTDLGLVPVLVQLVAHGDMGLAWQAAEAAVFLSGGATGTALVAAGAAEEMAYLLQESAEALHSLTLRKQIQVQTSNIGHGADGAGGHHQRAHPQRQTPRLQRTSSAGTGSSRGSAFAAAAAAVAAAAAAPAPLTAVHVRPLASAAASRPQRVFLVGRLPLDFTTSGSCFYGSHDSSAYCDYCTPSAAIKVLLRLMSASGTGAPLDTAAASPRQPPDAATSAGVEAAVCRRFAAAGGLYGVLLLLHHEGAGVHHSKLAASLLTLMDLVLVNAPGAQDELRMAGGLGVLTTLLSSLMRPGVMDVYQLRVATCRTLGLALQGNPANKLAAREHGLLPLLVSLVAGLAAQRKSESGELVVDDSGPLASAALDALAVGARDSPGTQEALVALGLMHPLCDFLRDDRLDSEVRTAAVRTLAAVVDGCAAGQSGALALGAVPAAVAWLERCRMDAGGGGSSAHHTGGSGSSRSGGSSFPHGPPQPHPQSRTLAPVGASEPALSLSSFLAGMLRGGNPHCKPALVAAGALPALLQLLRIPGSAAAGQPADGGADAAATTAGVAADVLATLVDNDTDLQNEAVAQGALTAAVDLVQVADAAAPQALRLLTAVLRSNTFVKNTARHAGLPAALVATVRRCGLAHSAGTVAAAAALTELAAGNHANQDAVAMQGGLEVAVDLAREAFSALPLRALTAEGLEYEAAVAARDADGEDGQSEGDGKEEEEEEEERAGGVGRGSLEDATAGPGPGSAAAAAATLAAGRRAGLRGGRGVAVAAAEAAAEVAIAESAASSAAALCRLLRAMFGLLTACVELNGGNKEYVRELGGVALLGEFLSAATETLTASELGPRRSGRAQGSGGRQAGRTAEAARVREAMAAGRAALAAALAAACSAAAEVVRESGSNLARLQEQHGLAVSLFKLLVASDAPTSAAAALALEWLVVRSTAHLTAPCREAFESDLVDVLSMALYVPYALPSLAAAGSHAAEAAALGYGHAAALKQQHHAAMQHGPWHLAVTALMPSSGVSAAAVRDAAVVLSAVADAADALEVGPPGHPGHQAAAGSLQTTSAKVGPPAARPAASRGPAVNAASLPRLQTVSLDAVASDHTSGLVVSSTLSGQVSNRGHGTQAWWAELAGSAAGAFQKVANGALQGSVAATAATAPLQPHNVVAAAAASQSAAGQKGAAGGGASAAGPTGVTLTGPAAERRRQVAWMLFLLAVKASENRARLRRQVRTSLTPLAQQLANAEACRAQLEASALATSEAGVDLGPHSELEPEMASASSAVLESVSSLQGRLPVSTAALEIGAAQRPGPPPPPRSSHELKVTQRSTSASGPLSSVSQPVTGLPSASHQNVRQQQQQRPHTEQNQQQHHHHDHPGGSALQPRPQPMPPQPHNRARSTPSGVPSMYVGPMAGSSVLYGAPPPRAAASSAETARDPSMGSAAAMAAANDASSRLEPRSGLSRANSGSAPVLSAVSALGAAGGAATSVPQRISLTGAAAAAFAPYPGSTAQGRNSRTSSPAPGFRGVSQPRGPAAAGPGVGAAGVLGGLAAAQGGGHLQQPAAMPMPQQQQSVEAAAASQRALRNQVSAGGSSGIMSDDDELAMIQQEVALLANTTIGLGSGGLSAGPGSGPGSGAGSASAGAGRAGYQSAGSGNSPAVSPLRWGPGRR